MMLFIVAMWMLFGYNGWDMRILAAALAAMMIGSVGVAVVRNRKDVR